MNDFWFVMCVGVACMVGGYVLRPYLAKWISKGN